MTLTTRMLTPETWDDFAGLVEANNGVWGGCWCIGFHPEGVGHGREGNRELKRRHVTRGTVHQVLVYDGERCVGWCQFGPPAEVATINNPKAYAKGLAELPDWRIGCIFTNAKDRGKGVAAAAVAAALDEIKRAGGGVVEAYPEQTEERPPQRGAYLHTGPEELYAQYGFTRVRKIAKWRWVMRTKILSHPRYRSRKEMHCGCDRMTNGSDVLAAADVRFGVEPAKESNLHDQRRSVVAARRSRWLS
jgi:GNAT superfamily N-acetyltransferase